MDNLIDINAYPIRVTLKLLLKDKTTGKNIIWAIDRYTSDGVRNDTDTIEVCDLIGFGAVVLQPRIEKNIEEQQARTRRKAEVFTPVWICNKMNNYIDTEWFGSPKVFNEETKNGWSTIEDSIAFPEGKSWKEYIDTRRLEITCGEAPYLVSRYDVSTGEVILPLVNRIGLLDRKMRIVNENTTTKKEWMKWVERAFQSCYGFEYQGDNLLIARINFMKTFYEYYKDRWHEDPGVNTLMHFANIISWNLWQMDGFSDTVPLGKPNERFYQLNLFEHIEVDDDRVRREPTLSKIFDWRSKKSRLFIDCKER